MCIPPSPSPLLAIPKFWKCLLFIYVSKLPKPIIQSTYEGLIQFWTHPYPLIHHQLVGVNCDLESNLHWRLVADVTSYHQCKSLFNTDTTLFWVLLECEAIKVSIRSYSRQRHCCLKFWFCIFAFWMLVCRYTRGRLIFKGRQQDNQEINLHPCHSCSLSDWYINNVPLIDHPTFTGPMRLLSSHSEYIYIGWHWMTRNQNLSPVKWPPIDWSGV